jgi:hypothetical protein
MGGTYHPSTSPEGYCTTCPAGTYAPDYNYWTSCDVCPLNKYSFLHSRSCTACPAGTYTTTTGSTNPFYCTCPIGYHWINNRATCTKCNLGTYNPDTINMMSSCDNCAVGFESDGTGVGCKACHSWETTLGIGDVCGCIFPLFLNYAGNWCILYDCAEGSYASAPGTLGVTSPICTICQPGFYTSVRNRYATCMQCPDNSFSTGGADVCTTCLTPPNCPTGEGSDLVYCESETGGWPCESCAPDTYNTGSSRVCTACPAETSSTLGSDALTDCKCVTGHTAAADGLACQECVVGTYKPTTGSAACSTCPTNTLLSPAGSDSVSDCQCDNGYTGNSGTQCVACIAGTYKSTIGSATCTGCPLHTTSEPGSEVLINCKCKAGYSGSSNGVACTACVEGTYKNLIGIGVCASCPDHMSSASGSDGLADCMCVGGYMTAPDGLQCTLCGTGT